MIDIIFNITVIAIVVIVIMHIVDTLFDNK